MIDLEKKEHQSDGIGDDLFNSCSSGDCTGLIPSSPDSEEEYESYQSVYNFQPSELSKTE